MRHSSFLVFINLDKLGDIKRLDNNEIYINAQRFIDASAVSESGNHNVCLLASPMYGSKYSTHSICFFDLKNKKHSFRDIPKSAFLDCIHVKLVQKKGRKKKTKKQ